MSTRLTDQYILGTNGLNAGIQAAPGFSYANQGIVYWANRLKGPNGEALPVAGSFDLDVDQNLFIYTSKFKLFGENFGAMFDLVIANANITAQVIGVSGAGAGITGTYVQPFTLGYDFPRVDLTVAHGFTAPTGRYCQILNSPDNIGSGYWGSNISAGSTIYLTTNITPGQTLNFEWGLGQALPVGKNLLQIGAVWYSQWQTTRDGGSGVLALGPQATFVVPKWNFNLFFPYEPEFGASARIEGTTVTFGGAISFPVTNDDCSPPATRHRCSACIPLLSQTAMGPFEAPQRPERNARASTVSYRTGETDAD